MCIHNLKALAFTEVEKSAIKFSLEEETRIVRRQCSSPERDDLIRKQSLGVINVKKTVTD